MEPHATPLLILPQSKLVENSARFLQRKIDTEKYGRDWICSQNLVSSLKQTKFYKSQSQHFPTDNIPTLESEASRLDLSSKRKCSILMKNIEIWEKRARKLIAINSHADLFSSIRNSSPPLSKPHLPQKFEVQPFPLPVLPRPDIPVGGKLAHFVD